MSAIVPILGLSSHLAVQSLAAASSAISSEAYALRKAANDVVDSVEQSQALFGDKAAILSQLQALAIECAKPAWDGEDAAAIEPGAVARTQRFLRALPNGVPLPELAPEPDGAISLDWIRSPTRLFSVSIGAGGRLAYAWLDGGDKGHSVAAFDSPSVPPRILEGIRRIMGQGYADVWVA